METPIRLGISSCLMGNPVRFDGGHKWDRFLTGTLGRYVDYVPVCPEVEAGFGIPREAFRLVGDPEAPRLITSKGKQDYTDRMARWCRRRVRELEQENLCGFIFKSRSPSSGMERVKVYGDKGMPVKKGVGMFARAFMEHFPRLPVEEEGRLHDPGLRENFIERIFTLKRWRESRDSEQMGEVVDFHTRNKLLILSHSPKHHTAMGRLVADGKSYPPKTLRDEYEAMLMEALRLKSTRKKHTNVLQHMMGYFKRDISSDEKQELMDVLNAYKTGNIPLIVPVTLFNHYVRKYNQAYLAKQTYLNPHPLELQLRNHV